MIGKICLWLQEPRPPKIRKEIFLAKFGGLEKEFPWLSMVDLSGCEDTGWVIAQEQKALLIFSCFWSEEGKLCSTGTLDRSS